MTKRHDPYAPDDHGLTMKESADGEWVPYADFEQVVWECAHLRRHLEVMEARWDLLHKDPSGVRHLLNLLFLGKGSPLEFDAMVDKIIESNKAFDARAQGEAK